MPTHESPAEQDLSSVLPDVMRSEEPVQVRHQIEGPLLSFSQEELKEKIRAGEQSLEELLVHIGIPPDQYTAEMIAAWTSADPNILDALPLEQLPELEREILKSRLWGCVGKGVIAIPGRGEFFGIQGTENDQFFPESTFTRQLRERIIFDPPPEDNPEKLYKLQEIALSAAWKANPTVTAEWIDRLKAEGREELARDAIGDVALSPSNDDLKKEREIAARFPWIADLASIPPDQPTPKTVDDFIERMEQREKKAAAYDAYHAQHPEPDDIDPFSDMWGIRKDEPSVEEQFYVSHPLAEYRLASDFAAGLRSYDSIEQAVAVLRFAESHPEAFRFAEEEHNESLLPSLFHRTLGILQRTAKEDIPEELMQFLVQHFQDPEVTSSWNVKKAWPHLLSAEDATEFRKRVEASCFRNSDMEALRRVLPASCDEEWVRQGIQDSRLLRAIGEFLSSKPTAYSAHDLRAVTQELALEIQDVLAKSGAPLERDGYDRRMGREGGGAFHAGEEWLLDEFTPGMAWILQQHRLSFTDAYRAALGFRSYRGDPRHDAVDRLLLARTDATVEELWEIVEEHRTLDVVSCRRLIEEYLPLFRKAFLRDIPRFTAFVSERVIAPLAKNVAESDNVYWDRANLLRALETMACFDAAEARANLLSILEDPLLAEKFHDALLRDPTTELPPLVRLCASDISYPLPEKRNLHAQLEVAAAKAAEKEEEEKAKMIIKHSPFAWALDREADDGVAWSARRIPILNEQAFTERWLSIVRNGIYPPAWEQSGIGGRSGRRGESQAEQERKKTMKELRDQALQQLDHPEDPQGGVSPDNPELPSASLLSENPKTVGVLSEPLTGDAQYILMKICDDFDPAWLAHMPTTGAENLDLREILQADHAGEQVTNVSLEMRMGNDAVIPLPMGNCAATADIPGGSVRSAGHWSKRVSTRKPVNALIQYGLGKDRSPGAATLAEVRAALPSLLSVHRESLGSADDFPAVIQERLRKIDTESMPLAQVVDHVQKIVHEYYEYHFLLTDLIYKEKYRALLQNMPYPESERNRYLDFIHSLREEHEKIQGRGLCGQLSTVLEALIRLGVPAYFGAGYCPSGTTITTNDAHAWVVVPFLDPTGKLFMKPVEATSGGMAGLDMARAEAPKVRTREEKEEEKKTVTAKERPSSAVVINDEIEQWRRHLQSCISPNLDALTREDIEQVTALVQTADKLRRTPLDKHAKDSSALAPHHLIDALTPAITAMSPETRNRLALLEQSAKLSPAGHALVQYLLREGKAAYQAHLQALKDSGYDKDLGISADA